MTQCFHEQCRRRQPTWPCHGYKTTTVLAEDSASVSNCWRRIAPPPKVSQLPTSCCLPGVVFHCLPADLHVVEHLYNSGDEQRVAPGDALRCLPWWWLFSPLTLCFVSALTELGDMEGYGHVYIGPFNPALCHAASLLAEHWEAGLASPGCLDPEWPNLPPITPPTRVLFTVLRFFRWAHVAVISGDHSGLGCGVGVWLLHKGCVQLVKSVFLLCLLLPGVVSSIWLMGGHRTGSGLCTQSSGPADWSSGYHGERERGQSSWGTESSERSRQGQRSEIIWMEKVKCQDWKFSSSSLDSYQILIFSSVWIHWL